MTRLERARMYYERRAWGRGRGVFELNSRKTIRWTATYEQFREVWDASFARPVLVFADRPRQYWAFQDRYYSDNDAFTADDVFALLVTRRDRQQQQVSRAREMVAMSQRPRATRRGSIPEDVKHYVWVRDQGRCRHCGAVSELQFDHVIPFSKGGSSSAENLQILCGPCNRRKASGIALI